MNTPQVERALGVLGPVAFEEVDPGKRGLEVSERHGLAVHRPLRILDHGGEAGGEVIEAASGRGGFDGHGVRAEPRVVRLAPEERPVDQDVCDFARHR